MSSLRKRFVVDRTDRISSIQFLDKVKLRKIVNKREYKIVTVLKPDRTSGSTLIPNHVKGHTTNPKIHKSKKRNNGETKVTWKNTNDQFIF